METFIGVSCYADIGNAQIAIKAGANYVAFGSVFGSVTKPDAQRCSLATLKAASQLSVPVVAIGGIRPDNAALVVANGIHRLAVIDSVFAASDPLAAAIQLHQIISNVTESTYANELVKP